MKNIKIKLSIITVLLIISVALITSCNKQSNDSIDPVNTKQSIEIEPMVPGTGGDPCPAGQHLAKVYEFNKFKFHRPLNNCETGFWFCFTDGRWVTKCVDNQVLAHMDDDIAVLYGEFINGIFKIHFPLEFTTTAGYTSDDLEFFSVDETYSFHLADNGDDYKFVIGQYPVVNNGVELIAEVDYTVN